MDGLTATLGETTEVDLVVRTQSGTDLHIFRWFGDRPYRNISIFISLSRPLRSYPITLFVS